MWKELQVALESLQNIYIAEATGTRNEDRDYAPLREEVLGNAGLAAKLPSFVTSSRNLGQFWAYIKKMATYEERRQHIWQELGPAFEFLEASKHGAAVRTTDALSVVDSPHVHLAWQAALDRKGSDPEGAITVARTLLESVCKHILDKASETYDDTWDLPKLYKSAAAQLNLAPQQHSELVFKQILGGCQTVVEGLGALRNKHGDAHGKGALNVRPSARHAGLAVHLAGGVAAFLIETYEEKGLKSP